MTGPAMATDVGAVETEQLRLSSLNVRIAEQFRMIGGQEVGEAFSDPRQAALESAALATPLLHASEQTALQEQAIRDADATAPAEAMVPALTLSKDVSADLLQALRAGGATMKAGLDEDFLETLQAHGFPNPGESEPALTFAEGKGVPNVLWDLMYDGGRTGSAKWESFWGFRVPVSHWLFETRPPDLRLQNGVFGGIHEDLRFAAAEIKSVARHLEPDGSCSTVVDHFRTLVESALVGAGLTGEQATEWIEQRGDTWLYEYLLDPQHGPADTRQWKDDNIIAMLKGSKQRHLLHFACHSTTNSLAGSRSKMMMKVGGADLTFDVGEMMAELKEKKLKKIGPGPLVFLNACRDIPSQHEFQPPPFATAWLQGGAQAVISAVCPVPDFFAHAFAGKYYDFLFGRADAVFDGRPVKGSLAGALLATRRYFMETHRNPLGLAYILYAAEHTRLLGTRSSG